MVEIKEYEGSGIEYVTSTIIHIEEPKEQEKQMIFEYKTTYVEIDSTRVVIPSNVEEPQDDEEKEEDEDEDEQDDRELDYRYREYIVEFPETPRDLEILYPNEIEEAMNEDLLNVYEVELDANDDYLVKPTNIMIQESVEPESGGESGGEIDSGTDSGTEPEPEIENVYESEPETDSEL